VALDVTARVQQWSGGTGSNYGWRLKQTTAGSNPKTFFSSEYATDTTLRPKLTIVYAPPPANQPPTVAIATPANGASTALGGSFALTTAGLLRLGQRRLLAQQMLLSVYWILHTLAAARAGYELLTRPHFWAKTTHGLTRLDRRFDTPGSPSEVDLRHAVQRLRVGE